MQDTMKMVCPGTEAMDAAFDAEWYAQDCADRGIDPDELTCFQYEAKTEFAALTWDGKFMEQVYLTYDQSDEYDGGSPSGYTWDWTCWERVRVFDVDVWREFDGGQFYGYPTARALVEDMHGECVEIPYELAETMRDAQFSTEEIESLIEREKTAMAEAA